MSPATLRRPGIAFEAHAPPIGNALPRLDIAAFVGFAASGPIGIPVAVEDIAGFHDLFGADVRLAWDSEQGDWQYGELAPTVRAFFRHGGRRCWVVRVARREEMVTNHFLLPGVLSVNDNSVPDGAAVLARAPGSWSDDLRLNVTATVRPLPSSGLAATLDRLRDGARPGDLVQLQYDAVGITAFLAQSAGAGTWFERVRQASLPATSPADADGVATMANALDVRLLTGTSTATPFGHADPIIDVARWGWRGDEIVVYAAMGTPWRPGSWLRLTLESAGAPRTRHLYGLVDRIEHAETLSPLGEVSVAVASRVWWLLDPAGALAAVTAESPRRATIELELWGQSTGGMHRLPGVGCASGHSSYWGDAPSDDVLFALDDSGRPAFRTAPRSTTSTRVQRPRFPFAAVSSGETLLPLGVGAWPNPDAYQPAQPRPESREQRDGLSGYDETIFLDASLAETPASTLLSEATQIQYVLPASDGSSRAGRALTGLHALLRLDEVAMIAAPDAMQRSWRGRVTVLRALEAPVLRAATREGSGDVRLQWDEVADATGYDVQVSADARFVAPGRRWDVDDSPVSVTAGSWTAVDSAAAMQERVPVTPGVACPPPPCDDGTYYYRVRARGADGVRGPWSNTLAVIAASRTFEPVAAPFVMPPEPFVLTEDDERNRLIFEWEWPDGAPIDATVTFTLERASDAAFDAVTTVYRGPSTRFEVWNATNALSYFRVSADVDGRATPWSSTLRAGSAHIDAVRVDELDAFDDHTLRAVHVALLRLCAARGDCHAILALPRHYRAAAADEHVARIADAMGAADADRTLSFGAMFHPWPIVRETADNAASSTWPIAPEGAICGVLADRTLRHAAWVSAANQPLTGVVSLAPQLTADAVDQLRLLRINTIVQQPRGFVALDEMTLSAAPELSALHVRRLLILIRRLALREGTVLLFEPLGDALRRHAERVFDQLLGAMYVQGAFAGATPDESYRVVADARVNARQNSEQGRLIVELRVAPSQPLNFITVRLVQEGASLLTASEGS